MAAAAWLGLRGERGAGHATLPVVHAWRTNGCAGDLHTFADIAESARAFNETAIGIVRASDGTLTLAPSPTDPFNLQVGDRVVVLAPEYTVNQAAVTKKKA